MGTYQVTLSKAELWLARKVALYWHTSARAHGRVENARATEDKKKTSIERDTEGATGEIAVAKALGLYYSGLAELTMGPDLGAKGRGDLYTLSGRPLQVRATKYPWGRLYIRPEDKSKQDQPVILVTAVEGGEISWTWQEKTYRGLSKWALRGWVITRDVMNDDFWIAEPSNGRPPYWEVEQHELLPMSTLNLH